MRTCSIPKLELLPTVLNRVFERFSPRSRQCCLPKAGLNAIKGIGNGSALK